MSNHDEEFKETEEGFWFLTISSDMIRKAKELWRRLRKGRGATS